MAVIQARGVNVPEGAVNASLNFSSSVAANSRLIAFFYYLASDSIAPSTTAPTGWTLVRTEQVYAGTIYGQVFVKNDLTTGSEGTTGFSTPTMNATCPYALVIIEASVGAQLDVDSGETDNSVSLTTTALTTESGGDVFAAYFQHAFGAVWTSADTLVAAGDATNTRVYAVHRVADATTETFTASSSQGGMAGWLAISFAPASGGGPTVVTVTGNGSIDVAGSSASIVAVDAGTWAFSGIEAIGLDPPVGAHLRLTGGISGFFCWVTVLQVQDGVMYLADATQTGDHTLADLAAAETGGSIEIRRYS